MEEQRVSAVYQDPKGATRSLLKTPRMPAITKDNCVCVTFVVNLHFQFNHEWCGQWRGGSRWKEFKSQEECKLWEDWMEFPLWGNYNANLARR